MHAPRKVFLGGLLIGGADETLTALGDGSFQAALEGGGVGPALPSHLREEVDRALQHTPKVSARGRRKPGSRTKQTLWRGLQAT